MNMFLSTRIWAVLVALLLAAWPVWAGPQTTIGPYQVEVTTDPATIPVGKANLRLKITANGQPVEGATVRTLTKMPSMDMGERQEIAMPQAEPGVYLAPAAFSMAGGYSAQIEISGPQGQAQGAIPLETGQNTGSSSGGNSSLRLWLLGIVGLAALAFVIYRMKLSGQKFDGRAVFNRQVLGGLGLLAVVTLVAVYVVSHFRRPGAMTPIESQGMEMNMPAPSGVLPVELATVERGSVQNTVRYTGQAVGFLEQEVYPRVQGELEYMPFYAGDTVKKGQLLARLDTSQLAPQVAEREAGVGVAEQGTAVARLEAQQAQGAVNQAQAELSGKGGALSETRSEERKARAALGNTRAAYTEAQSQARKTGAALSEAQSNLRAARGQAAQAQSDEVAAQEERGGAQADVAAMETQVESARAQVASAQANLEYWTREIERMKVLVREGAVSREEFQREQAQFAKAQAELRAAQANLAQVLAQVRGTQSKVRRAEAMIRSAQAKSQQAQAAISGSEARIDVARAEQSAAGARVQQAQADVQSARAEIGAAGARIRQAQADVKAQSAQIGQSENAAGAAQKRIAQAQANTRQARAAAKGAGASLGYAEIRAQLDGVVTQRLISPGTLVTPGQPILKIAQINPIRLQANVAESDLARIRVGTPVQVLARNDAKKTVAARVASVAPAIDPASRTGLVEVVVPNEKRTFVPGEYVVLKIAIGQVANALKVPTRAIQYRSAPSGNITSTEATPYVWVAQPVEGQDEQFTAQRVEVKVQNSDGQNSAIMGALQVGQSVIVSGAQNLQNGTSVVAVGDTNETKMAAKATETMPKMSGMKENAPVEKVQKASVAVTEKGYEPASLNLKAGVPARVTFTRKTDATCGTEVVFPDYEINRKLPLNVPTVIEFTPKKAGTVNFTCGMEMLRGKVVVQ